MAKFLEYRKLEVGSEIRAMTEATVTLVYVRYLDHVLFSRCSPLALKPQIREAVGWLNYECEDYIILSWDKDAEPPTLKGGDPKASGLVLIKSDITELRNLKPRCHPYKKIFIAI